MVDCPREDIVGGLARTNDPSAGCSAPDAEKFIPSAWTRFQPRCGLAVRTSPRCWRRTERFLERAGECRLGVVADHLGHLCEGSTGIAKLLSRDLHAPTGEVGHWRPADHAKEA